MTPASRAASSSRPFLALLALVAACRADAPTAVVEAPQVPITVSAALSPAERAIIAGMSVEVTASDIAVPIVAELATSAGSVSGTVVVPAGAARSFTGRAFDAAGLETHAGSVTAAVQPGANLTLVLTLYPRGGGAPVDLTIGTLAITVDVAELLLDVGGSATVRATVTDAGVPVTSGAIEWGVLNPPVLAAVQAATGRSVRVSALASGVTTLVASYGGVAAMVPVIVTGGPSAPGAFREVVAARGFTCALEQSGAAWCWGDNSSAQVGDGTFVERQRPTAVGGGLRFTSMGSGTSASHACAITARGEAWCWGHNGGRQLGSGGTDFAARNPVRVVGGFAWARIAGGYVASCALRLNGEALCWGRGTAGQLGLSGIGGDQLHVSPVPVTVGAGWASLSLGFGTSCGVSTASVAVCSNRDPATSPVTTASASGISWLELHVSEETWRPDLEATGTTRSAMLDSVFACGLSAAREVLCWGHNGFGQLGIGTTSEPRASPTRVAGDQGWDAVATGASFACALRGGAAWCWGRNDFGQLGDGTRFQRSAPTPVAGNLRFTRITAGLSHACALDTAGIVFCWGANVRGEVGDGSSIPRLAPVPVNAPSSDVP